MPFRRVGYLAAALVGALTIALTYTSGSLASTHTQGPRLKSHELMALLKKPGHIGFMRHSLAPFEGAPPAEGSVTGDCKTQRNLDEKGRTDAKRIGELFKRNGVRFEHIYTSVWCRCQETADLIAQRKVEVAPWLNSFFRKPERAPDQLTEIRQAIYAMKPKDRALLVTHGSLIQTLTGNDTGESEIVVVVRDGFAGLRVVGRGYPCGRTFC